MSNPVERLLRCGALPGFCAGATCCFAIYSCRVLTAADQWSRLEGNTPRLHREARMHTIALREHGWTSLGLALISGATTYEAMRDWRAYRNVQHLEKFFGSRLPFFFRGSVLATSVGCFVGVWSYTGAVRMRVPTRPVA